jgi:tetratricopeptide (TPR) repeat protein
MACSSEETTTPEIPGPSAASLLRTAWTHFEEGDYAGALDFFDKTLVVDSDSFEAHLGRGWSLLKSSTSAASLIEAETAFDQALLLETADSDALGGRAAARLSLGGAELAGAVEDAGVVLQQDPDYEFQHDPVFNDSALRIIQAQAQIALEDYDSALLALDTIYVSGIRAENSNTWVVEGLIESSFGAAVIAHLDRIERLWLGGDL